MADTSTTTRPSSGKKPNTLPVPIDDLTGMAAPLLVDTYLDRQNIIDRITDIVDPDGLVDRGSATGEMTAPMLARVLTHLDPERDIRTWDRKQELQRRVGDIVGFDIPADRVSQRRTGLRKDHLIRLLLFLATGQRYGDFATTSDSSPTSRIEPASGSGSGSGSGSRGT